jgi:hypothetical protein
MNLKAAVERLKGGRAQSLRARGSTAILTRRVKCGAVDVAGSVGTTPLTTSVDTQVDLSGDKVNISSAPLATRPGNLLMLQSRDRTRALASEGVVLKNIGCSRLRSHATAVFRLIGAVAQSPRRFPVNAAGRRRTQSAALDVMGKPLIFIEIRGALSPVEEMLRFRK